MTTIIEVAFIMNGSIRQVWLSFNKKTTVLYEGLILSFYGGEKPICGTKEETNCNGLINLKPRGNVRAAFLQLLEI